ncbi:hypothetical protein GCM10007939_11530 [Amylibacter marinus]|uniref:DUF2484 family protein n=1 Tax=Amylibacter marinus TaxID=1475483 RepID=A0ABQ5VUB9_9RHOB|nr:DUF2484 family protein [Amylibacter marinus]GLQ34870.1 hypothetical protein GCM10007939_11530 [Amylibacter marinus]
MNYTALIVGIWIVTSAIVAMTSTRYHRFFALYVLIPTALILIPLIGYSYGLVWMLAALLGAGSVLRWPVYFLTKFFWSKLTGRPYTGPPIRTKGK